jgi:hypothetical protein
MLIYAKEHTMKREYTTPTFEKRGKLSEISAAASADSITIIVSGEVIIDDDQDPT